MPSPFYGAGIMYYQALMGLPHYPGFIPKVLLWVVTALYLESREKGDEIQS
jgi:hypothetical protein